MNKLGLSQYMNKHMLKGLRKCDIKLESFMEAKLDERSKILSDSYAKINIGLQR